jgi:hypothetical protein
VYTIKRGDTLSRIADRQGVTLVALLAANPRYKADPNGIGVGDKLEIPGKTTATANKAAKKKLSRRPAPAAPVVRDVDDDFTVPFGQLTFDAEGLEKPGRYFSRRLHVPGPWSGATIGRGYDMGERSRNEIVADLGAAGLAKGTAEKLAQARGLKGKQAKDFISAKGLAAIEVAPKQQKALFMLTYKELEGDVIRICTKADVVAKYGALTWEALDPTIRDVLVDLRYRGDYTGATREKVQSPAVKNSLSAFSRALLNEDYWVAQRSVPRNRFRRRRDYLERG